MPPVLAGFTIGITGDRRADEQVELLRRRGATVLHGPVIETVALADSPELRDATVAVAASPPRILVVTTGVGIRSWMEAADGLGLGDELRAGLAGCEVLARSPKAAGAAVTAGLAVSWQAPGERNQDVLAHLAQRDLTGVSVAVQRDGADAPTLAEALAARGAAVVDVPVYRWVLPRDLGPAHRLLDALADRQLDAITVTSSPALANLLALGAERPDAAAVRSQLTDGVLVASVGPVCTEAARAAGITRIVQPARYRLGSMIRVLTDALHRTGWRLTVGDVVVQVQGGAVEVDGRSVTLARREQLLLAELAAAEGAVVAKAELGRRVWGPDVDPHVVEVTVGRLRSRLGPGAAAVVTVPRRGYRLASAPER